MFRWFLLTLFLSTTGMSRSVAQTPVAKAPHGAATASPTATAAKQAFDQMQKQWIQAIVLLQKKSQEKSASADSGRTKLDLEIETLHQEVEGMVDKIVASGLQVHQAGLTNDPTVNSILINIAGFYVAGDPNGNGGDQYEKALPLIKAMLDAGLGNTSKELWLWGGVSAFSLNQHDLAKQYFSQAQQAGLMGNTPLGQGPQDPRFRIWVSAKKINDSFAETQQAWQKEQQIRASEAKADDLPRVKLHTTRGDIVLELFENEAPIAVANFVTLVKQGYYDGLTFHRVLPAFMAQGGDNQRGGPGYTIPCECSAPNTRIHFRGSLSMAHAGRDTGSSQFFLTFVPTSHLNRKHTVFGRILQGIDVAAALKRRDPDAPGPKPKPDKIIHAHVLRDRGHEYQFKKLNKR